MKNKSRVIGALAIIGLVAGCNSHVEDAVRHELIDPDSAQFRDVKRCTADRDVYKGEVNAKNRMGAYTGFEPFFYDGVTVAFAGSATGFTALMNRCYEGQSADAGGKDVASADGTAAESKKGDWITSDDVNPVDDSATRRAFLVADEGTSARGESVTMTIRCQSNKTELYVNWQDYLGDDSHDVYSDWKLVTQRVGEAKAKTVRWDISTDNNATFARSPIGLIKEMLKADRLVLQTTPYNENPTTAVFKLEGMKEAISPIAKECGWSF